MIKHCEYCEYDWTSRTQEPKSCPRCKRRFDYPAQKLIFEMNLNE